MATQIAPATLTRPGAGHLEVTQMPEAGYKRCSVCRESKPLDEFHRMAKTKDGHHYYCKPCNQAKVNAWQRANRERVAEHNRRWREADPKKAAEIQRRWREANRDKLAAQEKRHAERHPEKHRARAAVTRAVHRGNIAKPDRCERCERTFQKRELHAHHHDYSKPLDVEWFCEGCHLAEHGKEKRL